MENIIYVSVGIIAISFMVLVIYLVSTLRSLKQAIDKSADALIGLEKQVEAITQETTALLSKTNQLADDLNQKSEKLNSLFSSVEEAGSTITKGVGMVTGLVDMYRRWSIRKDKNQSRQ